MPLFKRRQEPDEEPAGAADAVPETRLISEEQLIDYLQKEMIRLEPEGQTLAVLSVVAQSLPDERLRAGEMDFASSTLLSQLRAEDVVCVLGEGALMAVLHTNEEGARVVAHRVASDLAVRSYGGMRRKWLTGTALFPDDGEAAHALVQSAIDHAN